jgi:hypothetical protein
MKFILGLIFILLQAGLVLAQSSGLPPEQPKLLNLQAKAYLLMGALTDNELEKAGERNVESLAAIGTNYVSQDNPVLERIAKNAGITVNEWFARLSASDVVRQTEAVQIEPELNSTGSAPVRAPDSTSVLILEPHPPSGRAVAPEMASRPPPAPVVIAPVSVGPPPAEVDRLLKHGKELFALGNIAGARALFSRAATGNDPSALTALAQTYDPQVLGTIRVLGIKPDPARAKALYDQAEAARKRR